MLLMFEDLPHDKMFKVNYKESNRPTSVWLNYLGERCIDHLNSNL